MFGLYLFFFLADVCIYLVDLRFVLWYLWIKENVNVNLGGQCWRKSSVAMSDLSQWDSCSANQCLCSNCSTGSSCKSIAFITILLQISPPWISFFFSVQRLIFLSQFLLQIDPQLQTHIEALIKQWPNCSKTPTSFFPFANVYNSWDIIKAPKAETTPTPTSRHEPTPNPQPTNALRVKSDLPSEDIYFSRKLVLYDQLPGWEVPPLFGSIFCFNRGFKVLH